MASIVQGEEMVEVGEENKGMLCEKRLSIMSNFADEKDGSTTAKKPTTYLFSEFLQSSPLSLISNLPNLGLYYKKTAVSPVSLDAEDTMKAPSTILSTPYHKSQHSLANNSYCASFHPYP